VNGATPVAFTYDADSLLTQAGALSLTRDPQHGLLTGSTLGSVSDTRSYSSFAELSSYAATLSGTPVFQVAYTRDALGRITQKTETIGGVSTTFAYAYDPAGRLTGVTQDSIPTATYTYDANGNRLSVSRPSGTVSGTYDAQDRLLTYGALIYTYTANGELQTATSGTQTTTYTYDPLGNLLRVTRSVPLLPGTDIEYVIDGQNRRVGKKVNGILTQGFLYRNQLNPVAELDGAGNLVSRFIYASKPHVPDYMVKGGVTYRIVSDHLGSPRLIVDTATGTIAQRLDYDEFGQITLDTNPGFQPFGFAGGLYDPDTQLLRFGARDYDPFTGRWTLKDELKFYGGNSNLYGYVLNDAINFIDQTGLRIEWGGYVLNNPYVRANLERLNQEIVKQGLPDNDFVISVTGGDRYRDVDGQIRSLTDDQVVKDSDKNSPHLIARGARAVDVKLSGVCPKVFEKALAKTEFLPANTIQDYADGHVHIALPDLKRFYYGYRQR
jgi:RHS repeat-associated protein